MITKITDFINIVTVSWPSLRVVECIILGLASGKSRLI